MKKTLLWGVIAALAIVGACGGGSGGGGGNGDDGDDGDDGNGGTTIPSGSLAVFSVMSESSSDTMNIDGNSIEISAGTSYIYRYVVDVVLDRLDDTLNMFNNYSCDNAGSQRPITSLTALYNAEFCPDYDDEMVGIDLEQYNPSTKAQVGSTCAFNQSGTSRNFAIVGDELFYRKPGGTFVKRTLSTCSGETELMAWQAVGNTNRDYFFGIGSTLISILQDTTNEEFVVRTRNTSTGAITAEILTIDYDLVGSEDILCFFEGDDALYWWDDAGAVTQIYRYPLTGQAAVAFSVSAPDPSVNSVAIDASGGKIFLGLKTTDDAFDITVANATTGAVEAQTTGIDSSFFRPSMQFYAYP